jgi:hypothetical protein
MLCKKFSEAILSIFIVSILTYQDFGRWVGLFSLIPRVTLMVLGCIKSRILT